MDIALHDTYYVVAQMGLNNIIYSAIDYMLETISLTNYLLFIPYFSLIYLYISTIAYTIMLMPYALIQSYTPLFFSISLIKPYLFITFSLPFYSLS